MVSFKKNILKQLQQKDEVDYLVIQLVNLIRIKGVVLPKEFDELTRNLSKKQYAKLLAKLKKLNVKFEEDMLCFTDDMVDDDKITENELLNHLIKPEYIDTKAEYVRVGTQFYQGIVATGFPAQVTENWLGRLIQEKGNVDFTIHLSPASIRNLEIYLNSQLKRVENDLYKYTQKGINNPSLENRKRELLDQLNSIIKGTYKLYKMSLYIASKGINLEKTQALNRNVMSALHANGIEGKHAINYQQQLIKSLIPTGIDHLRGREIFVPGPAAAASFPFSSSFYDVDEDNGVLLGFNDNNIPIAKSIWALPKYIGAVIGATGAGKSYASKALVLNDRLVNKTKVFVLDPEGEYIELCKNMRGGKVISLNRDSKTIPNILGLMGASLTEKIVGLTKVFDVLLEGITDTQKPLLEKCLIETYKKKGIVEDKPASWKKKAPKLADLVKSLKAESKRTQEELIKTAYELMISKLSRFTEGMFKFIGEGNDDIDFKSDFVVFEFKTMPEEVRPVLMMLLLEYIKSRFIKDSSKKMLVLDEAWRMLKSREEANYIEGFARTFRKHNGGMLLITQSVAELKDCPEGKAFLANTAFRYLLKTEKVVLEETSKLFGLNAKESEILATAGLGEGILIWENNHHKINISVDPETHKLITTHPEELRALKRKRQQKKRKN